MRISQDNAQAIANKMTEAKQKKVSELYDDYINAVKEAYEMQLPKEVMAFFQKFPSYCETTTSIKLDSHGFNREYVGIKGALPSTTGYSAELDLNAKLADRLNKLRNKWDAATKAYKKLNLDIKTALLSLKTYKAIRENFPEAVPFLPERETMALAVNFSEIRKELKVA